MNSMSQLSAPADSLGSWHMSERVCALADSERHLGHILKVESVWIAFDATRLGENGRDFRFLGIFPDPDSAKLAVELASARVKVLRAN